LLNDGWALSHKGLVGNTVCVSVEKYSAIRYRWKNSNVTARTNLKQLFMSRLSYTCLNNLFTEYCR